MKNTLKEDICLDQGPVPGNTPIMHPCHAYTPQVIKATNQIFTYELLLTVPFKHPQGHIKHQNYYLHAIQKAILTFISLSSAPQCNWQQSRFLWRSKSIKLRFLVWPCQKNVRPFVDTDWSCWFREDQWGEWERGGALSHTSLPILSVRGKLSVTIQL